MFISFAVPFSFIVSASAFYFSRQLTVEVLTLNSNGYRNCSADARRKRASSIGAHTQEHGTTKQVKIVALQATNLPLGLNACYIGNVENPRKTLG